MEFDVNRARYLLNHPDEEERRKVVAEIPDGWTAGALAVLIEALGDDSWRVRKDVVMRLAAWPDPDSCRPTPPERARATRRESGGRNR